MAKPQGATAVMESLVLSAGGNPGNQGLILSRSSLDAFFTASHKGHLTLDPGNSGNTLLEADEGLILSCNAGGGTLPAGNEALLIKLDGDYRDAGILIDEIQANIDPILRVDAQVRNQVLELTGTNASPPHQLKLKAGDDSGGNAFEISNSSGTARIRLGVTESGATAIGTWFSSTSGENVVINADATDSNRGLFVDNTRVVGPQQGTYGAPTGTATRSTFNTGTVTLSELAERVHAIIDDLRTHGLLG